MEKGNDSLLAGIAEMRATAKRLNEWADDLEASFQARQAGKKEVEPARPVSPRKGKKGTDSRPDVGEAAAGPEAAKAQEAPVPLSLEEVRSRLAEKCAAGYGAQVKSFIEAYGVSSLREVPPEAYGALLLAADQLGGEADAG